jgi:putative two-component system response regulator
MSAETKKIIIVDDNPEDLIAIKNSLKDEYEVYPTDSASKMFEILEHITPDLILLDVEMPVMDGYEAAKKLKESPKLNSIPIIFLTAKVDPKNEMEGLNIGALDYIHKPFVAPLLVRRIQTHLTLIGYYKLLEAHNRSVEEMLEIRMKEVMNLQISVLNIVADLIECRDELMGTHLSRVPLYLSLLIEKLVDEGIYTDELISFDMDFILPSSMLHDIGKLGISENILNKPGKLTDLEYETVKRHVQIGVDAISRMEEATANRGFFRHAKRFAAAHHENWDGSGYPNGLKGLEIPLEGRLLSIVDAYDAIVSVRQYKPALDHEVAVEIIRKESGTHFDPKLVDIFCMISDQFKNCGKAIYT